MSDKNITEDGLITLKQLWLKRRNAYRTNRWSGGETTEIFIYPEDGSYPERRFGFRLSSATVIENESLFSDLSGFYRYLMPLNNTITLIHDEHIEKKLAAFQVAEFDGGLRTQSIGQCRDFNLMVNQQWGWSGQLEQITRSITLRCTDLFTGFLALDDKIILESKKEEFLITLNKGDFLMVQSESDFDVSVKRDSSPFKMVRVAMTKKPETDDAIR